MSHLSLDHVMLQSRGSAAKVLCAGKDSLKH